MQIYSLMSRKGGTGKTTIALHLAYELDQAGGCVLLDLDPQQSAAKVAERREAGARRLDIQAIGPAQFSRAIEAASELGYAFVVIDTPPIADSLAMTLARASTEVLIPVQPAVMDLDAIETTIEIAKAARKPARVIVSRAHIFARAMLTEVDEAIIARRGFPMRTVIRDRAGYRNGLGAGRLAQEIDPVGAAARDIAALAAELTGGKK